MVRITLTCLFLDPDTEYRRGLVAYKTTHGGQHHGPELDHGLGMDKALNRIDGVVHDGEDSAGPTR
jgi:hypothetical protein